MGEGGNRRGNFPAAVVLLRVLRDPRVRLAPGARTCVFAGEEEDDEQRELAESLHRSSLGERRRFTPSLERS